MLRSLILIAALISGSTLLAADMGTSGSDHYACPGSGDSDANGSFKDKDQCAQECQNIVFDCSQHKLMINGQPKVVDGEDWLGCAGQTGKSDGSKPHKFKKPEGSACGRGQAGRLPQSEPKIESDPLPCDNCVIHRMTAGAETAGCLGLSAKLFDFVFKTCGGCSYTITPESGGGGGGGSSKGGNQNSGDSTK